MDKRIFVVVLAAAAVTLAGCDNKPKNSEKLPGFNMKIRMDKDHTVTMGVDLPKNMPSYAQVYAGANVESVVDLTSARMGYVITYEVPAQAPDVLAFYKKNAAAAGLNVMDDSRIQNAFNFAARKEGSKETLSVTIAAKDGGTFVQLRYS